MNPLVPAELVIDHSVQVDEFGTPLAYEANALLEFQRNRERYAFLKWGQTAFRNFSAVPPGMGICHQVNLEYLARVVFTTETGGERVAYPDTLVGTDSHTTMINGLGVLGWGVGGIEAEAAMLGQAVSMLVPQVVGYRLTGKLREGATATDLVLTVTQALRKLGVVASLWSSTARRCRAAAGRPGDHQQHGSRIWRNLRHLPGRCGDTALSAADRPQRGADRAGRGLLQRAGALPHCRFAGGCLHANPGTGPGDRGAERGWAEAPARSRVAEGCRRQLSAAVAGIAVSHGRAARFAHGGGVAEKHGDGRGGGRESSAAGYYNRRYEYGCCKYGEGAL